MIRTKPFRSASPSGRMRYSRRTTREAGSRDWPRRPRTAPHSWLASCLVTQDPLDLQLLPPQAVELVPVYLRRKPSEGGPPLGCRDPEQSSRCRGSCQGSRWSRSTPAMSTEALLATTFMQWIGGRGSNEPCRGQASISEESRWARGGPPNARVQRRAPRDRLTLLSRRLARVHCNTLGRR